MAHINIDNRILENLNKDDMISTLNRMIDNELSKNDDSIDTVFVDECVDALLELEQEDNNIAVIIPLISSDAFLKKITANKTAGGFKRLNVFARVAIVAAIIAGGTMTANATIEAVTNVNVLKNIADTVHEKLIELGVIENMNGEWEDDEEETTAPTTKPTTTVKETTTVPKHTPIEDMNGDWDDDEEETTAPTTTKKNDAPIEDMNGEWEEDDETTTTTTKPTQPTRPKPSTTQQTTAKPVIEQEPEENSPAVFTGLRAEYGDEFKFDYIYGEELSYEGLTLIASYDDGTEEVIPLEDCKYTRAIDTTVTEDVTISILYKSSSLSINLTVRPDEFTRGSEICTSGLYDYLLTDDGAYITAYKGAAGRINLDELDGNKVIAIGPSCFKNCDLQSFTAENVTRIYGSAFEGCASLTNCYTPSVDYIGEYAFSECTLLDRAVYSQQLEYLGEGAYNKCEAIEEIVIPQGVTAIPDYAFNECTSLRSVQMLGDVESIGKNAFNECTALESVTGCSGIKAVGEFAFAGNELMNFDSFPQSLESVGTSSFYYCMALEIGPLPSTIRELAPSAFSYCYGMTRIEIPQGIAVIPENCFRATNAKEIILPEGVTTIEEYAFMSCKAKSIVLPKSLRKIGTYGLYSVLLRSVYFSADVEFIGKDAFYAGKSVRFYVYENTVPMYYAAANEIKYELLDSNDTEGE